MWLESAGWAGFFGGYMRRSRIKNFVGKDLIFDEAIRNLWFLRTFSADDYERLWKEISGTMIFVIEQNIPDDLAAKWDWDACWQRLNAARPRP
jgi:hypothetical protein